MFFSWTFSGGRRLLSGSPEISGSPSLDVKCFIFPISSKMALFSSLNANSTSSSLVWLNRAHMSNTVSCGCNLSPSATWTYFINFSNNSSSFNHFWFRSAAPTTSSSVTELKESSVSSHAFVAPKLSSNIFGLISSTLRLSLQNSASFEWILAPVPLSVINIHVVPRYPMKIAGSAFVHHSIGVVEFRSPSRLFASDFWTKASWPNLRRCRISGFSPVTISCGVIPPRAAQEILLWWYAACSIACPKYEGDTWDDKIAFFAALERLPIRLSAGFKDCRCGIPIIVVMPSFAISSQMVRFALSPSYITNVDQGTLWTPRFTMMVDNVIAVEVLLLMTLHSTDQDL